MDTLFSTIFKSYFSDTCILQFLIAIRGVLQSDMDSLPLHFLPNGQYVFSRLCIINIMFLIRI